MKNILTIFVFLIFLIEIFAQMGGESEGMDGEMGSDMEAEMSGRGMGPPGMGPSGMGPPGKGPNGMGPPGMGPPGMGPPGMRGKGESTDEQPSNSTAASTSK
ncbi:uncharacterized protein isoform X2 [Leptinotarsa decemlineata]|uniref:uncharacterized protein isoform X2 n=1 Tax=Leptinotarsa decemlineata TaxID=7539 RepID=UPI003D30953C